VIVATDGVLDTKVNVPARLPTTSGLPRTNGRASEFLNVLTKAIEFERIGVALVKVKVEVALVANV
jgi:hypothetical protein